MYHHHHSSSPVTLESSYLEDAKHSLEEESARKAWYRARAQRVLSHTSAHAVLDHFGVKVTCGTDQGESIPCPFHGDNRPSAKIHPENSGGPSHLWCYVCRKNWNAIQLWMTFQGVKYSQALAAMEKFLALPALPLPSGPSFKPPPSRVEEVKAKLESVERIFRYRRQEIPRDTYLKFCVALDRFWGALEKDPLKVEKSIPGFLAKLREVSFVSLPGGHFSFPDDGRGSLVHCFLPGFDFA